MSAVRPLRSPLLFAVAIFASAFLLFQVQPLIGKRILPWFGGTPAVWSTCMLFFQLVLFAGYVYAHLLSSRLRPRYQAITHALLLLAALGMLPIIPPGDWKPDATAEPVAQILGLLAASVGLPYFALSATGPLLQRWYAIDTHGASPYRLYALSNIGSLLALISYPIIVEPQLSIVHQGLVWSLGFVAFAVLCGLCAVRLFRAVPLVPVAQSQAAQADASPRPTALDAGRWFVLAMLPSVMLLATTNQVCMDVAVVPFLWVLPLTLYLLSFILCFDSERWYARKAFSWATLGTMLAVSIVMLKGSGGSIIAQVGVYFSALFFCCMVCHGELVRLKPPPAHLTAFYLTVSAGGAAGGLSVGLIAPLLFTTYFELPLAVVAGLFITWQVFVSTHPRLAWGERPLARWGAAVLSISMLMVFAAGPLTARDGTSQPLSEARNFYGILRVEQIGSSDPWQQARVLRHGRIVHGMQFLHPERQRVATTYYAPQSGIGQLLSRLPDDRGYRVGVIGLGVGTLATYGRPGDEYRFYEINPDVTRLAREHFTFLQDSPAEIEIVGGDARLMMEQEPDQQFDVLVVDAFSGDSIPVHLLTEEAMQVYLRHLKPGGALAFHVSNLHFNLRPVVAGVADRFELESRIRINPADRAAGAESSIWMLLSGTPDVLSLVDESDRLQLADRRRILWTDDYSNLFEILR